MHRDFTLKDYIGIAEAALNAGYKSYAVVDWFDAFEPSSHALVLRHDVDRRPLNALAMARAEDKLGIRATYYFRIVPIAFVPSIIREIAALGHEIGYHYEDFHLAGYQPDKAHKLFCEHLDSLRAIAPIQTIAMHGSPLAKFSNMDLWKTHAFSDQGVRDCLLSADWSQFTFFTDTGRRFGARLTNLRDTVGGKSPDGVKSSADVASYLRWVRPERVHINVHPERWNDAPLAWLRQLAIDVVANSAKLVLRAVRSG